MNSAAHDTVLPDIVTMLAEVLTLADAAGLSLLAATVAQALAVATDRTDSTGI